MEKIAKNLYLLLITLSLLTLHSCANKDTRDSSLIKDYTFPGRVTSICDYNDNELLLGFKEPFFLLFNPTTGECQRFDLSPEYDNSKTYCIYPLNSEKTEFLVCKRNQGVIFASYQNDTPRFVSLAQTDDLLPRKGSHYSVYDIVDFGDCLLLASSNGLMSIPKESLNEIREAKQTFPIPFVPSLKALRDGKEQFAIESLVVLDSTAYAITDNGIYEIRAKTLVSDTIQSHTRFWGGTALNDSIIGLFSNDSIYGMGTFNVEDHNGDIIALPSLCKVAKAKRDTLVLAFADGRLMLENSMYDVGVSATCVNCMLMQGDKLFFMGKDERLHSFALSELLVLKNLTFSQLRGKASNGQGIFAVNGYGLFSVNDFAYKWLGEVPYCPHIKSMTVAPEALYVCDDTHVYKISTEQSLYAHDRQPEKVKAIQISGNDRIECLDFNDGELYIGTRNGLFRYDNSGIKSIHDNIDFQKNSPYITDLKYPYAKSLNNGYFKITGDSIQSMTGNEEQMAKAVIERTNENISVSNESIVTFKDGSKAVLLPNQREWRFICGIGILIEILGLLLAYLCYLRFHQEKSLGMILKTKLKTNPQAVNFASDDTLQLEASQSLQQILKDLIDANDSATDEKAKNLIQACKTIRRTHEGFQSENINSDVLTDINALSFIPKDSLGEVLGAIDICIAYEQASKRIAPYFEGTEIISAITQSISRFSHLNIEAAKEARRVRKEDETVEKRLMSEEKERNLNERRGIKETRNQRKERELRENQEQEERNVERQKTQAELTRRFKEIAEQARKDVEKTIEGPKRVISTLATNVPSTLAGRNVQMGNWVALVCIFLFRNLNENSDKESDVTAVKDFISEFYIKNEFRKSTTSERTKKSSLYASNDSSTAVSFLINNLSPLYWEKMGVEALPHTPIDLLFALCGLKHSWIVDDLLAPFKRKQQLKL